MTITATKSRKASTKTVRILARYALKRNGKLTGTVVYRVLSSNGLDIYHTTLHNGIANGCTCPSYKPCYHQVQLETIEQFRMERALAADIAREQATAVRLAEAQLLSERESAAYDEDYEQWKIDNGLDQPLTRDEFNLFFTPNF